MRSSASSSSAISGTPLTCTGSDVMPRPMRSALAASAAIARSMRATISAVSHAASAESVTPTPTIIGRRLA